MDGYVDAVIKLRVPKWQVGQEAFIYFKDTMSVRATCEDQKHGKWIDNETSYVDNVTQTCECSVCGRKSQRPLGDFCRWCGADMRGE